jgi:ferritin-like metal-binding protein YciE
MSDETIQAKLVDYVRDAHAMEINSLQMLKSMLLHTSDGEMRSIIEAHVAETEIHRDKLAGRLEDMGEAPSAAKKAGVLLTAAMKGMLDQVRPDKPGKDARDAFVTEAVEIAAYELLRRLADRAGDRETAQIASQNLAEEEAMAERISSSWDKVIDLTIEESVTA